MNDLENHTLIQVVSRRLPTAAGRGPPQVKSCEMWSKKWYGEGFLQVFVPEFPLLIFVLQTAPHSLIILSEIQYGLDTDSTVIYILFGELHVRGILNYLLRFKLNCTYRLE